MIQLRAAETMALLIGYDRAGRMCPLSAGVGRHRSSDWRVPEREVDLSSFSSTSPPPLSSTREQRYRPVYARPRVGIDRVMTVTSVASPLVSLGAWIGRWRGVCREVDGGPLMSGPSASALPLPARGSVEGPSLDSGCCLANLPRPRSFFHSHSFSLSSYLPLVHATRSLC